jgi:hypothetical protein
METPPINPKAPEIDDMLESIAGLRRQENRCVFQRDGKEHNLKFRDDLSRKEFSISGMCQSCQDSVFGADEDD